MSDPSIGRPAKGTDPQRHCYRFDDFEVDAGALRIRQAGREVRIERRPLQLLIVLLQHVGELVTKDELFEEVWDSRIDNENALQNAVGKLRKALGAVTARRVETVAGSGYRFAGPVQRQLLGIDGSREHSVLRAGDPVPMRPGWRLDCQLGQTRHEIWLARDGLDRNRVLKFAHDSDSLRTLKRERTLSRYLREVLGDRPEFCFVIGENFEQQPCFLEFEYGGADLLSWDRELQCLPQMSLSERIDLFMPVAGAVAAAHDVAVLHKDIKPANILVQRQANGGWTTRLTDFGSGHAVDLDRIRALGLTVMGVTIEASDAEGLSGTPSYLAPELLAGQPATVQTDVFALGLVLFQIVVADLHRPLAPGWERDVPDELLREDIQAATDGNPKARLANARALLDRLSALESRRAQRAELARAAEQARLAMEELARRRARRPWAIAATAFLAAGLLASLLLYGQSREALQSARAETRRAEAIGNFLHRDVLEASDAITAGVKIRQQTLLDILRKAASAAPTRFEGQPLAEAITHRRLAQTFIRLAALVDARNELIRSIDLLTGHVQPDDRELLLARFLQVRVMSWQEYFDQARTELEAAENLAGTHRLSEATELSYAAARARFEFEYGMHRDKDAHSTARRLVTLADATFRPGSPEQADARQRLANISFRMGDQAGARAVLAELTRAPFFLTTALIDFEASWLMYKGQEERILGHFESALQLFEQARQVTLGAGESANKFALAWCYLEMASNHERLGQFQSALIAADSARELFKETFGEDHQYTIAMQVQKALVKAHQGQALQALALFDAVERQQTGKFGGREPWKPELAFGRALCFLALARYQDAMNQLTGVDAAILGRNLEIADAQERLSFLIGQAMVGLGQPKEGQLKMAEALASMERKVSWSWLKARFRQQLADLERGSARSASAT